MKKLKRIVASLLAVLMLLGVAPVTALAGEIELHHINTTQQPAEEPAQEPVLGSEDVLPEEDVAEAAEPAAVSSSLDYRIVHLDCGRKYFSVEYIKSVIDTMAENGFNQLELAFGNGGLRFVLDNMDIKSESSTLHNSEDVKAAIRQGNERFYNDPNGNSLSETDMKAIITYAQSKGVEIVPLLNMPGHMDGVLSSDLFSQYKLSGSEGSLDLNNSYAVDFGKALLKLYVDWFRQNSNSKFFNFGADEYGQGIRNPYIESSVAKVTYDQLISYMNDCADIIEGQSMTARCFNDFVCYNRRTDCNLYKTVQVCYWSNQWNNSEYNTPDVIKNAGYKMINTNQKWYFVPSKADEYGKSVVLNNFTTFDVTKYQNIKSGYNPTSTTYTEIPVGTTNVGAMFCVWCDTPSVDVALADVQDLIAAMATANPNYFTKGTTPTPPTIKDGNGHDGIFEIIINALLKIFLPEGTTATWTVTEGTDVVELVADGAAAAQTRSAEPAVAAETAAIMGNAVQVRALKAGTATITATLDDGTAVTATVTVKDNTKKPITVTVGGTEEVLIEGNHAGTYTTANPETATVTAEYAPTAGGTYYDKAALAAGTFYISANDKDAAPTVTVTFEDAGNGKYYIKRNSDGKYIYPNASYSYLYGWTYSLGTVDNKNSAQTVIITAQNGDVVISRNVSDWYTTTTSYLTLSGSSFGARGSSQTLYIYTQRTEEAKDQTKLTFIGHKVGTTTVTIAGVEYTINVAAEDLSNVTLPVNLWITNTGVVPKGWSNGTPSEFTYSDTGNRRSIYTLKANYQGVYSENGIALKNILPEMSGTATSSDGNYDVVYWKSAYHTAKDRQSTDGWTNFSGKGTDFTYIRYWGGSWAYSVDGSTWVNIENVGAEAADTKKNQVNIWYRQKTEITTEVETQIVDWGPVSYSANQCLLDFAVKYESGERVPNSFPVTGKTMGFDCPTNQTPPFENGYVVKDGNYYYRVVHGIAGVETADYEVYMITVTPSSDTHTTYINNGSTLTSYTYDGTEKIAWAKTEEDANSSVLTTISTVKYGGEPFLESVKIYQYQGLLVTYYVRAKETADSLKVHYINRSNNNEEFYNYSIAVKQNTVFNEGFAQKTENSTELVNNTVENKKGEIQTVLADLKTMPQIAAQYRYSNYTCVEVNRSKDGKEVFLYYTFNSTQTFVVDFGLPLVIKPTDMNSSLGDATIEKVEIAKVSTYADITVDENKNIVYKLNQMISGHDNFGAKYTGNRITAEGEQHSTVEYSVTIIPATTVYYEDSFVDFYDAGSSAKKTAFTKTTAENDVMGVWYVEGDANTTAEQALSKLGDKAIYGYDPAYNNSTMFSMDSAKKVTVNTNGQYAQAKFTFKGTGFDIISLTDNQSGAIYVSVYRGDKIDSTKRVKGYVVNNYYGYTQDEDGNWVVDTENKNNNALYQIPVMKVDMGTDYDTYTVEIKVAYSEFQDVANNKEYSFWLDAIRVYNPMGKDNETYVEDGEGYPQYIKLRDEIKNSTATVKTTLFIDGADKANVEDYNNFGPNNEVYLANGQAISFKLDIPAGTQIASVQIGAKAPNGNADLKVNTTTVETITTATEMYYNITEAAKNGEQVTITNNTGNILSLTNLKITYSAKEGNVSLAPMSTEEQTSAVMMVRAMFAPPAPTVFEPETFTVSLKNYKDVYVREYIKVTVTTSDDVKYITVGDKKISRYDDERVWGGFRKGFVKTGKRIWSYYVSFNTAGQQVISVVAYDADGLASEAVENTVNIKPRSAWRGKKSEWHI